MKLEPYDGLIKQSIPYWNVAKGYTDRLERNQTAILWTRIRKKTRRSRSFRVSLPFALEDLERCRSVDEFFMLVTGVWRCMIALCDSHLTTPLNL